MKFYHRLYLSEELVSKKMKIINKIEKNKLQIEKYLIVLAKSPQNHLEIFNSVYLLQDKIEKDDLLIVGITKDKQDAIELVEKITQEVYDETNGTDIKTYILHKQQEYEEGNV